MKGKVDILIRGFSYLQIERFLISKHWQHCPIAHLIKRKRLRKGELLKVAWFVIRKENLYFPVSVLVFPLVHGRCSALVCDLYSQRQPYSMHRMYTVSKAPMKFVTKSRRGKEVSMFLAVYQSSGYVRGREGICMRVGYITFGIPDNWKFP